MIKKYLDLCEVNSKCTSTYIIFKMTFAGTWVKHLNLKITLLCSDWDGTSLGVCDRPQGGSSRCGSKSPERALCRKTAFSLAQCGCALGNINQDQVLNSSLVSFWPVTFFKKISRHFPLPCSLPKIFFSVQFKYTAQHFKGSDNFRILKIQPLVLFSGVALFTALSCYGNSA